jgi:hypothetical protein
MPAVTTAYFFCIFKKDAFSFTITHVVYYTGEGMIVPKYNVRRKKTGVKAPLC